MPSLRDRVKGYSMRPSPPTAAVDAFIEAADDASHGAAGQPWHALNKKAVPRTTFNLRLNDYELALLRWLAEQREESMQKVAKRLLIPALERVIEERMSSSTPER